MSESTSPFRPARMTRSDGGQGYDYIFTGVGCAALSIVMRMIKSGSFADKKILLVDKEPKTKNDRTWCFWEKENGFFEEIVYKKWETISFLSKDFSSDMPIAPYQYKMIRGIDLYQYCFKEIEQQKNIDILYGELTQAVIHKEGITLHIDGRMEHLDDATIFNSILPREIPATGIINLLQHFKGWMIETSKAAFDPTKAVFMDFRVRQKDDTTFAYVLPISPTKALVEYTLFSKELLPDEVYEAELKNYLDNFLQLKDYRVIEKEFGVIPMTNKKFSFREREGRYNIGTAGGMTKASSGYTFQYIQKQAGQITDHLMRGEPLSKIPRTPNRFTFYDKVLLDVLYNKRVTGEEIFTTLFKKNKPQQVLKFLDNESSFTEELKIITKLPTIPFLKAAINYL
jgi:lycopene beta-cyclase